MDGGETSVRMSLMNCSFRIPVFAIHWSYQWRNSDIYLRRNFCTLSFSNNSYMHMKG